MSDPAMTEVFNRLRILEDNRAETRVIVSQLIEADKRQAEKLDQLIARLDTIANWLENKKGVWLGIVLTLSVVGTLVAAAWAVLTHWLKG